MHNSWSGTVPSGLSFEPPHDDRSHVSKILSNEFIYYYHIIFLTKLITGFFSLYSALIVIFQITRSHFNIPRFVACTKDLMKREMERKLSN